MPRISVFEDVDNLPESCAALFHGGVFASLPWFRVLAPVLGQGAVRIVAVRSGDGEVHALMPMCVQSAGGFFAARRLRAAANFYTPLFNPLVADGASTQLCLERDCARHRLRRQALG